jgi:hypothetical protein
MDPTIFNLLIPLKPIINFYISDNIMKIILLFVFISFIFAQDAKAYEFVYFENLEQKIWTKEEMLASKPIPLPMISAEEAMRLHGFNVTEDLADLKEGIMNTR